MNLPCLKFRSRRVIVLFTLACLIFIFNSNVFAQDGLRFETIGKGVAQLHRMHKVVQDSDGFMWFGGEVGLTRFDAHEFVHYKVDRTDPNALMNQYIWDMVVDQDGVLWIATMDGLHRYNPEQNNFTRFIRSGSDPGLISNALRSLAVDSKNRLLIGTHYGLSIFDKQRKTFKNFTLASSRKEDAVVSIFADSKGRIWLGMTYSGLVLLDEGSGYHTRFEFSADDPDSIPPGVISAIAEDKNGHIWVGTDQGGLAALQQGLARFQHYTKPGEPWVDNIKPAAIYDLHVDHDNKLWIAMDRNGLLYFDPQALTLNQYVPQPENEYSIDSDIVRSICKDASGNFWFGLFPEGINYLNMERSNVQIYRKEFGRTRLSDNRVLDVLKTPDETLWVGTEGGLNRLPAGEASFEHYSAGVDQGQSLRSDAVLSLENDGNNMWLGTWSGGLHYFDAKTKTIKAYPLKKDVPKQPTLSPGEKIWALHRDAQGTLWVGSQHFGLSRYDSQKDAFYNITSTQNQKILSHAFVWDIIDDKWSQGKKLWVGTIFGLNLVDKKTYESQWFHHDPDDETSLSSDRAISLYQDSKNRLWVGTMEGGVNMLENPGAGFKRYDTEAGLPSPYVSDIGEDSHGMIWLLTGNGIAIINPETDRVTVFDKSSGLAGSDHNRHALHMDGNGGVYAGSVSGLSFLSENTVIQHDNQSVDVILTHFLVLNKEVDLTAENAPIKKAINYADQVVLGYRDNLFTIGFSALHYAAPEDTQYAYMLKGFDKDWYYVNGQRTATYTNLSPGDYQFMVMASTGNDRWNGEAEHLQIKVLPPPYLTRWAFLLYGCLFLVLVGHILYLRKKYTEFDVERKKNETLSSLNETKDHFFARASQEFRSPLNGVSGIMEAVLDGEYGELNPSVREKLKVVANCASRLNQIANEILDYSGIIKNKLKCDLRAVSLQDTVKDVFVLAELTANERNVQLQDYVDPDFPPLFVDAIRLQQILHHFIENAIRHTENGYVKIVAIHSGGVAKITVQDNGIGMSKPELKAAFEEAYGDEALSSHFGLGLSLAKKLIELQGGTLSVESKLKVGSVFEFTLPLASVKNRVSKVIETEKKTAEKESERPELTGEETILIVDDDDVNLIVLNGILRSSHYNVVEAKNGQQALDIMEARDDIDLILLDVMMPGLNGYEVCRELRLRYSIEELPILFVTAKGMDSDRRDALEAGGNTMIPKPVSKDLLLPQVHHYLVESKQAKQRRRA